MHDEIYVSVDQILNPYSALSAIIEAHCCTVAELFYSYKYDYTRSMIIVCFSATISPAYPITLSTISDTCTELVRRI